MKYFIIFAIYLLIGIVITLASKTFKKTIRNITDDLSFASSPHWKQLAFILIVFCGSVLAWFIFLKDYYSKENQNGPSDDFLRRKVNINKINKAWLQKRISFEEANKYVVDANWNYYILSTYFNDGDELWTFSTSKENWKRLYEGLVIIRNNEIVYGIFTNIG